MSSQPSSAGSGDRGLQVERTQLAWRRTTLVATTVTLLGMSQAIAGALRPAAVTGLALVVVAWLAILGVAHRRIRALTHHSTVDDKAAEGEPGSRSAVRSDPPPPGHAPGALALLAAAVALAGLMLLLA